MWFPKHPWSVWLSLLAALSVLLLWGWSHFAAAGFYAGIDRTVYHPVARGPVAVGEIGLWQRNGRIFLSWNRIPDTGVPLPWSEVGFHHDAGKSLTAQSDFGGRAWWFGGFDIASKSFGAYGHIAGDVAVPHWALLAVFLLWPAIWYRRQVRARRRGFEILETSPTG